MSARLTSEQLDQLEAALEAMTPPPWAHAPAEHDDWGLLRAPDLFPVASTLMEYRIGRDSKGIVDAEQPEISANAHGIALLRNQARALVAAARETERLRDALEEIASRENWGIGEHEGNDATVWQGDIAPFDIARAALGEQR